MTRWVSLQVLACGLFIPISVAQMLPQSSAPHWEKVETSASSDANGDQLFVETSSLKLTTEGVEARMLVQLRDARTRYDAGDEIRSIVRIEFVDCSNRRLALTAINTFADSRARGSPIEFMDFARNPLQWRAVQPGSADEAALKFVCDRAGT